MSDARKQLVGLGVATVDDILMLAYHPRINEKQRILSQIRQGGGLTGSALVAASRLGCGCVYMATLGEGELSRFMRTSLEKEGIRVVANTDDPEVEPYHSIILCEESTGERSILSDNSRARPPRIGGEELDVICNAGCLYVDHVWAADIHDAVGTARGRGVPVVGDFEREVEGGRELMKLVDHLIIPLYYARGLFGDAVGASEAVTRLASEPGRTLACVTDGVAGAWWALGSNPGEVRHQPVFHMEQVVDTTGCGDVFHGVYAAGVVLGWDAERRVRCASAAAALKTQKSGAQAGAPTLDELRAFLGDAF